jgi:peptidoglycan hydrolase-like protein with peptidoglycan-binding domain
MTGMDVMKPVMTLAGERENNSNNITTVTKYLGMNGQPYCGGTIEYAMKKSGCSLLNGCSNPRYVPTIRQFMSSKGWRVPNADAQPGDIICVGPNQHVCFCFEAYSGATTITLEGNATVYATAAQAKASNAGTGSFEGIGYKKRYLGSNCEVYRPPYDGGSGSTSTGYNTYITEFQKWLNQNYAASLSVDGVFGRQTRIAAAKALQKYLNKTYNAGLSVDGGVGTKTKAAMQKYKVYIKKGDRNDLVYILQGLLYCRGYDPKGFDGEFGGDTEAAVKKYQKAKKITIDGEAGADTFASILAA